MNLSRATTEALPAATKRNLYRLCRATMLAGDHGYADADDFDEDSFWAAETLSSWSEDAARVYFAVGQYLGRLRVCDAKESRAWKQLLQLAQSQDQAAALRAALDAAA